MSINWLAKELQELRELWSRLAWMSCWLWVGDGEQWTVAEWLATV